MAIYEKQSFKKGMTYALFWSDISHPEFKAALDRLATTACNYVALAPGWWQADKFATEIYPHPHKTPDDRQLKDLIAYIHELGMEVLLKPFVDSENHEEWRGHFDPSNTLKWFKSYEKFISHYARMAKEMEVALFSVGVENVLGNKKRQLYWVDVIATVKMFYQGPLTFSSNFEGDTSYKEVDFWKMLDYIGIDAYFPVANKMEASVAEIVAGWKPQITEIEKWLEKKKLDLPVLFTELGTCSYKGSSKAPYSYPDDVDISEKEQENYYRAFFEAFADREWLNGVYWWWWDNPSTGDYMGNRGEANSQYAYLYTPQGKPAEDVLKEYYG
ncbi:MAG: hypothetical protein AAFR87_29220 [Bacteroidota bacterium]